MNTLKRGVFGMWRTGLVVAAGGTVLASSCNSSDVRTVLAGIELVANQIDQTEHDNNRLGDWLSNVLD